MNLRFLQHLTINILSFKQCCSKSPYYGRPFKNHAKRSKAGGKSGISITM